MTQNKVLTFQEWFNSEEFHKDGYDCNQVTSSMSAWNFCESQYKSEIEELKIKFSEATKTYTDDIDRLEKENDELKKKHNKAVSSQQEKIQSEKEKVEKLKKALEFVEYQFRTSLGDSNDMMESIKVARKTLKEVEG